MPKLGFAAIQWLAQTPHCWLSLELANMGLWHVMLALWLASSCAFVYRLLVIAMT